MGSPETGELLEECASTNDELRRLGNSGAPHGSWLSARRQTSGRGRLGREWQSLDGNLFLSILLRPHPSQHLSWIPLAVACGVSDAIHELLPKAELRIKWPNDLWVGGKKAGGILCEGASHGGGAFVIAGIGINCAQAPADLDAVALQVSADSLRPRVVRHVVARVDELTKQGPSATRKIYETRALFPPGAEVSWTSAQGDRHGHVVGLGDAGELIVHPEGEANPIRIYAEDVRIRALAREA